MLVSNTGIFFPLTVRNNQMQDIYIDANVWNFVFDNNIDLLFELPENEFRLLQTREAEFENNAIPEDKIELKAFIKKEIKRCGIQTIFIFGFNDNAIPENERRFGGLEENSVWITSEEKKFRNQQKQELGKLRKSKLFKNEADIAIASKSFESIVLLSLIHI